ncbi:MAG: magnesium transporter [Candidatus Accumulibacter phosphatis]|jgi:magnesium transporter|uniref:Magnesium transporter MgtE n=1 Tax=Candidatus Accumulibacter contiguus TaxID=2954381 RepID=A0ABX1T7N2_9PROT|nr:MULTISPECIES: magnesium transporter [Candidatus Accumulibacter]MBL8407501.1 magnesium transporter [Accumulibacter sp.]NMQ05083.1 magnesium transporter [Candidatus Accumulibacter contiguus]HRF11743.1 magnesium transporter [Candidatus Accumulibacter phosphatis]
MHINVETKPATLNTYDSRKKRLVETIDRLYHRDARGSLQKMIARIHPADMAAILDELPPEHVVDIFHTIGDKELGAEVFSQMGPHLRTQVMTESPVEKLAALLEHMQPDDLTDLVGELPEDQRAELMAMLGRDSKSEVESLLKYDPNSAGGIMTTEFFSLPHSLTVEQAIESIRSREDVEMVFYLYLTDEEGRLVGVVSLRQLLLTRPDTALRSIMNRRVIKVNTDADQTTVALLVDKYRLLAIPVVDQDDILVGMVTVDDVIDVIEEETTRDMLKMAGTSESETFTHSALKVAGIRLPWLLAAFIGGLAATMVIEKYESILAQVLVLSAFLPVIMGMAGNVGVQSATVAVRGLATGAIDVRDTLPLVLKELRVGLVLGGFYGVILAAYGYLMHDSLQLGQVVGLTILGNMTGAALLAVLLPMIFQRLKVDPAVATGPFVTTAIDILGVLNYFVIASWIYKL